MKQLALIFSFALISVSAEAQSSFNVSLQAANDPIKAKDEYVETKLCRVEICNKISRFSLDPWSHIKDSMGETCYEATIPKAEAQAGKVLDSSSRWYQGSLNPTKKSVTKIKRVISCQQ